MSGALLGALPEPCAQMHDLTVVIRLLSGRSPTVNADRFLVTMLYATLEVLSMGFDNIHLAKRPGPCDIREHGPIWCDYDPHAEQRVPAPAPPPPERNLAAEPRADANRPSQGPAPMEAPKFPKSPAPAPATLPEMPLPMLTPPEQPKPAWTDAPMPNFWDKF